MSIISSELLHLIENIDTLDCCNFLTKDRGPIGSIYILTLEPSIRHKISARNNQNIKMKKLCNTVNHFYLHTFQKNHSNF